MAQPASSDEVAQAAALISSADSQPASRLATPAATGVTPDNAFQAINSRAVSENAQVISPATVGHERDSSSDLTPPASEVIVAPPPSQTAQLAANDSQPPKAPSRTDNSDGAMAENSYGTRSSRRSARPNYAEDQDMDFEFTSAATTTTKKKQLGDAPAVAASSVPEVKRAQESSAILSSNGSATGTKESTPGTSTAAAPAKKRKAAGTAAAALQSSIALSTPPPTSALRKPVASNQARSTNLMTFYKHKACINKKGELVADDGTKLSVNDHVYLVCEPPGDPYYLCRVMEFLHADVDDPTSPVDSLRVNWYYRPRDVQRFSSDTRLLFGTMHSDMCPLTSLRGKCIIRHRSEIEDLDAYRKERDSFYFVQVFDRFIRRSYECIPVQQIVNVPDRVKKALDERWKFVVVEISRVKELTSAAKSCKRCTRYCASSDSVDCAICKNSYHMNCVQPPLPKKPSRGFAWACGPCSRASEKKLEARSTTASEHATEAEEEDVVEEEEPLAPSNDTTRAPSPNSDDMIIDDHPATQAEIALAKMWPMRYLGIHARVEDALQYDDRAIYPRASSRLGPRHQANVNMWHGRPVELIKPAEIKKRFQKSGTQKKESKLTKETLAAIEADKEEKAKRPKWVQDEPQGYVARGEDYDAKDPRCTATLIFKMPSHDAPPKESDGNEQDSDSRNEKFVNEYISRAKSLARGVGVPPFGTNFLDKAFELLTRNNYNVDAALKQLQKVDRVKDLHEPVLSKAELIKFEEGVAQYGSEHRLVRLHMKTNLPHSDIVRFYYLWKKTPKGKEIWGNFGGRKKRKVELNDTGAKLQAELANDADDSAYDNNKAAGKACFQCKFCHTNYSRQWRRAPGLAPGQTASPEKGVKTDKRDRPLLALCLRCAGLWRKYAIQWEEVDEVARKVAAGGGRGGWKKRIDEELLQELLAANDASNNSPYPESVSAVASIETGEPPKKKAKTSATEPAKKVEKPPPPPKEPTPPPPPIIPAQPTWKNLPCSICKGPQDTIACAHCKLTVHRQCFGLDESEGVRSNGEVYWVCEQCQNDRNPTVSTDYSCCLCLTEETQVDLVEPPKVSHKKKSDRDKEKERMEKELADAMRAEYRNKQLMHHRPFFPREPLKRTTGNNWVHVYCAIWTPEIRFSNAAALEVAEGFQLIPQARFEAVCKLCKNKDHQNRQRQEAGACVNCFQCAAPFHASCAFEAGYTFGFDVQPVKGSRKDQVTTATLGAENGALTPVIFCKDHVLKNAIHAVDEVTGETGKNALQIYAETYKQADLTLTGTVRKAAQAQLTKDKAQQPVTAAQSGSRRESTAHSIAAAVRRGARNSTVADAKMEAEDGSIDMTGVSEAIDNRLCVECNIDVTPRWHAVVKTHVAEPLKSPEQIRPNNTPSEVINPPSGTSGVFEKASDKPTQQNVRFMPIGANGRAWDGMPDRYSHGRPIHNERGPNETPAAAPNGLPTRDSAAPFVPSAEVKAETRRHYAEPVRVDHNGEVFHAHVLPHFNNPAAGVSPRPEHGEPVEKHPAEYLCHKCYLKKSIPTPPPEQRESKPNFSSPRQPSRHEEWSRSTQPPARVTPNIEEQFHVWDRPIRQTPAPPPPPVNGMSQAGYPPPHLGGPPPHGYGPPYGQQPNGFHTSPHAPHPGPHVMHERQNSYNSGYAYPPQSSPNPSGMMYGPPATTGQHHQQRPAPLNGFPPTNHTIPGGSIPSPHNPPLQSPTYPPPPQHQQSGPGPYQLHPLGPPNNASPHAPFGRPSSQPIPPQHPPLQQGPPNPMQHPQQQQQQQHQGGPPAHYSQPTQQPEAVRSTGSEPPRPTTPRTAAAQANGMTAGASASPNLMNLIH